MPRTTDRRLSKREAPGAQAGQRPRIEQQRRFFSSRSDQTAVRTATALQNAFGVATEAYATQLADDNAVGRKQAVEEAGGGAESRDNAQENMAYKRTWDKLDDQLSLQRTSTELPQALAEAGGEGMTEKERQTFINGYMQDSFKGLDSLDEKRGYDRDRTFLSEGLMELEATMLSGYRINDIEATRNQNNEKTLVAARDEYEATGQVSYDDIMERTGEFNFGSNKPEVFWAIIGDISRDSGDLTVIENVPEKFPNGDPTNKNTPEFQKSIDQMRANATATAISKKKIATAAFEAEYQGVRAADHSELTRRAALAEPSVIADIITGGQPGPNGEPRLLTGPQQKSLFDKWNVAAEKAGVGRSLGLDFGDGNLIGGTQSDYDAGFTSYMDNISKNFPDGTPDDEKSATLQTLGIERSVVNGRLPSIYEDRLSVNINNPAKYKEAATLYAAFEAQLPGFVESQLNDSKSRQLAAYNKLLGDTGSEQLALEAIGRYETSRAPLVSDEIAEVSEDIVTSLANEKPGWGDYPVTPELERRVTDEIKHYVNMGYDVDEAAAAAQTAILKRTVRAGDYLYAKDAGWEKPELEAQWAIENEARHLGVDSDSIELRPHPRRKDIVVITNKDAILPGTGYEVPISEIVTNYKRYTGEINDMILRDAKPDDYKIAEERAYEKLYPFNTWVDPGMRAGISKMQRRQWEVMPQADKDRLIRQEFITQ